MFYFIYLRPDNTYYFKLKGYNYHLTHSLGYENQYGHKLVLIISVPSTFIQRVSPLRLLSFKIRRKIINVLEFMIKKLN